MMNLIDTPKLYSVWKAPFMAFWSKSFYRDVYRNWRGIGFFYMALLSMILAAVVGFYLQSEAKQFDDSRIESFVSQVPNIRIEKGILSSDVKQPYVLNMDEGSFSKLILDTTGKITSLPDDAVVLVTRSRVITRKQGRGSVLEVYDLDDIDHLEFHREQLTPWLHLLRDYLPLVIALFSFVFILVAYLMKSLLYAVVVMLFTKSRHQFGSIFRLVTFALTPGFILDYALASVVGLPWTLIFLVNIGYVILAVKSITTERLTDDKRLSPASNSELINEN